MYLILSSDYFESGSSFHKFWLTPGGSNCHSYIIEARDLAIPLSPYLPVVEVIHFASHF